MCRFTGPYCGFAPQEDWDAAVNFTLNVVLSDRRTEHLANTVTTGHPMGGMGGDPGWDIERRDPLPSGDLPEYPGWPPGARFLVSVDPGCYELAHPDCYLDAPTFFTYVRNALARYVAKHPERAAEAETVLAAMRRSEAGPAPDAK